MALILLPSDLTEQSHHAAAYAVRLFGAQGNTFVVVHAYSDLGLADPVLSSMAAEVVVRAREQLDEAVLRLRQETGAEGISGRMEHGPISAAIQRIVSKEGGDLVVMGRSERTGASLLGSNTIDVVQLGRIAVLAVPASTALVPPRRIVLAIDHDELDADALAMLRTVAIMHDADVKVVHITEETSGDAHTWEHASYADALQGVRASFDTYAGDDVAPAIIEVARAHRAGMVAVLHRKRGLLQRLFSSSVTRDLVMESDLPLLVLGQNS